MKDYLRNMLPIKYRGYYDVPRMFVVEYGGVLYLFDAPFNDKSEEFEDTYTVYVVPDKLRAKFDEEPWIGLEKEGQRVGSIKVEDVHFDPSMRQSVDAACLAKIS